MRALRDDIVKMYDKMRALFLCSYFADNFARSYRRSIVYKLILLLQYNVIFTISVVS